MTTQSSPLKGSGAAILDYLYDDILSYYEAAPGQAPKRPRDLGPNDIVFGLNQLHGSAAESLGIDFAATGGMTKAQFYALAAGRHPVTGEQLVERRSRPVYVLDADGQPAHDAKGNKIQVVNPRTGEGVRETTSHVGIDVYFAAPKTVSIARVVAEEENPTLGRAISEAHARAVAQTLSQIEQSAFLGRRSVATPTEAGERIVTKGPRKGQACKTQGSVTERIPVQLLVASVAQHCARPTEETQGREAPPDMHLHQHNLILNLGVDPTTGKVGAIDDYGLKAAAAKHDAWYLGHLSRELQDLGIELEFGDFEESRHGRVPWRVKGIDLTAEDHYSSGRRRAWNLAKDYEERNPGKAATQTIVKERMRGTRMGKDDRAKAQDSAPVWSLWTDDAARSGLSLATEELRARMRDGHRVGLPDEAERHRVLMARLDSAKGLTMNDATFTGADITEALARCAEGLRYTTDELASLELELYDSLVVVRQAREPRHVLYATQTQLDMERRIETAVAARVAGRHRSAGPDAIQRALAGAKVDLDHEQLRVVEAVCSGRGAVFIEGLAGTGKTTAMATAVTALREAGAVDQVIVVSTASRTAETVGERLGADFSGSVETLALHVRHGQLHMTPDTVIIYDESAMCDTRRQDRFLAAAGPARVVYVGDPHQAQPIGAGGWYLDASERHGTELLTAVHRQKDPADIAMNAALRDGQGHEAVASLAARGRLHVSPDNQATLTSVIEHYTRARDAGRSADDVVVLLDSSNAHVDLANRQIQHVRRARQEISGPGFEVEETATARHWSLHAGDHVLTLTPVKTSVGKIPNGTSAKVIKVDARGRVTLALNGARQGRLATVDLARSAERQPLGLAYAVHTTKYQGGEAPVVLAVPGARGQTTKFSAYSTLTRATEEVHVFPDHESHGPDPARHLGEAWSEANAKQTATRAAGEASEETARREAPNVELNAADKMLVEEEMRRLTKVVGPRAAADIRASDGFEDLQRTWVDMKRDGHDVGTMTRQAARDHAPGPDDDPAQALRTKLDAARAKAESPSLRLGEPTHLRPPMPPKPTPVVERETARERRTTPGSGQSPVAEPLRANRAPRHAAPAQPAARTTNLPSGQSPVAQPTREAREARTTAPAPSPRRSADLSSSQSPVARTERRSADLSSRPRGAEPTRKSADMSSQSPQRSTDLPRGQSPVAQPAREARAARAETTRKSADLSQDANQQARRPDQDNGFGRGLKR